MTPERLQVACDLLSENGFDDVLELLAREPSAYQLYREGRIVAHAWAHGGGGWSWNILWNGAEVGGQTDSLPAALRWIARDLTDLGVPVIAPASSQHESTHTCRCCVECVNVVDGAFAKPGWGWIARIDGPNAICPTCISDPTALDPLREDYPHAALGLVDLSHGTTEEATT